MAQAPHVKKQCGTCGRKLTPQSFVGTISEKIDGFIVHKSACFNCMSAHYSKGE